MDLLFKRYASPYLLLDEIIAMGAMRKFIDYLLNQHREDLQWEYWLHKVQGMSFEEYKRICAERSRSYAMSSGQIAQVRRGAKRILGKINPGRR
jgi:hypothetical protein